MYWIVFSFRSWSVLDSEPKGLRPNMLFTVIKGLVRSLKGTFIHGAGKTQQVWLLICHTFIVGRLQSAWPTAIGPAMLIPMGIHSEQHALLRQMGDPGVQQLCTN